MPPGLQVVDLSPDELPALELPEQALPQPTRHGGAVPLAEPVESRGELGVDADAQAEPGQ